MARCLAQTKGLVNISFKKKSCLAEFSSFKEKGQWGLILSTHLGDGEIAEWNNKDIEIKPKFLGDQAFLAYIDTVTQTQLRVFSHWLIFTMHGTRVYNDILHMYILNFGHIPTLSYVL